MTFLSIVSQIPADLPLWIPRVAVGIMLLIAAGTVYFAFRCLRADGRKTEGETPVDRS